MRGARGEPDVQSIPEIAARPAILPIVQLIDEVEGAPCRQVAESDETLRVRPRDVRRDHGVRVAAAPFRRDQIVERAIAGAADVEQTPIAVVEYLQIDRCQQAAIQLTYVI